MTSAFFYSMPEISRNSYNTCRGSHIIKLWPKMERVLMAIGGVDQ
jgi:hypothetical protein